MVRMWSLENEISNLDNRIISLEVKMQKAQPKASFSLTPDPVDQLFDLMRVEQDGGPWNISFDILRSEMTAVTVRVLPLYGWSTEHKALAFIENHHKLVHSVRKGLR